MDNKQIKFSQEIFKTMISSKKDSLSMFIKEVLQEIKYQFYEQLEGRNDKEMAEFETVLKEFSHIMAYLDCYEEKLLLNNSPKL